MAAFLLTARRQRLKQPLLAVAALASLVLAACGGDDDEPPTPTLPPALPTQAPALQTTPTATPTEEVQTGQEYVVQEGDTLGAIAAQFGVTVEAIVAANELANPDLIQPGDTLTIPPPEGE